MDPSDYAAVATEPEHSFRSGAGYRLAAVLGYRPIGWNIARCRASMAGTEDPFTLRQHTPSAQQSWIQAQIGTDTLITARASRRQISPSIST